MTDFMKRALELANKALEAQEVPVGCVFIFDNQIIAESHNTVNETHNPTRHAEMNCIDTVMECCEQNKLDWRNFFRSVTVYVTVEPCLMCAAALHQLNIHEVVYGCANDRFGGDTVLKVSDFYVTSYKLTGNIMAEEAMMLLKTFYKGTNPRAPECKVKKKK